MKRSHTSPCTNFSRLIQTVSETTKHKGPVMQFLIVTSEPFRGIAQSVLTPDGRVAWSGEKGGADLTVEEYQARHPHKTFRVVTSEEMETLERAYIDSLVTEPQEITQERYDYALDVLPPSRFRTVRGVQMFHICERITADLVSWFGRCNG